MNEPVFDPRLSESTREALKKVDFGLEVQAFLSSKIGKYLVERATAEVESGVQKLKDHDVMSDPKGAVRLQSEIWRAESFMYWLADAVNEGAQLMQQLIADERASRGDHQQPEGGDVTGE